jgi:hypothetical protein
MRQARQDFIDLVEQPTGSFKEPEERIIIEAVGIGFFDRLHGQRGMARSGIPRFLDLWRECTARSSQSRALPNQLFDLHHVNGRIG